MVIHPAAHIASRSSSSADRLERVLIEDGFQVTAVGEGLGAVRVARRPRFAAIAGAPALAQGVFRTPALPGARLRRCRAVAVQAPRTPGLRLRNAAARRSRRPGCRPVRRPRLPPPLSLLMSGRLSSSGPQGGGANSDFRCGRLPRARPQRAWDWWSRCAQKAGDVDGHQGTDHPDGRLFG